MDDDEVRARFDGGGRVELRPGNRLTTAGRERIEAIAHALGYRLVGVENLGFLYGVKLVYERDDGPLARRRNELAVARLRAGGPLLLGVEPPAPPLPPPPPPAVPPTGRPPRRGGGGLPSEPPPPPPAARPPGPRVPPPPAFPPPPPPPPAVLRKRGD
ncbi:hypothetical protein [Streptomyces filamentosus]|uniref:hypothetical protein n=1 Tax=Streptomyces filamentosus TaxID=67294 RepID=UPI00340A0EBD